MRILSFLILIIIFSITLSSFAYDEQAGLAITEWFEPDNTMNSISTLESSIKAIQELYESGKIIFSDDESKAVFERSFLDLNYSLLPLIIKTNTPKLREIKVEAMSCHNPEDCEYKQRLFKSMLK